jgi:hypothetical protein
MQGGIVPSMWGVCLWFVRVVPRKGRVGVQRLGDQGASRVGQRLGVRLGHLEPVLGRLDRLFGLAAARLSPAVNELPALPHSG